MLPWNLLYISLPLCNLSKSLPLSIFPKYPFLELSFSLILIVLLPFPDAPMPFSWSCSDLVSNTCTLSTALAPIFCVAMVGSSPKNSSPSTSTRSTFWPCAVICPFLSTSRPGIRLSNSCTLAPSATLKLSALYSIVSPLIITARFCRIITSASNLPAGIIEIFPRSFTSFSFNSIRSVKPAYCGLETMRI